jgi:Fe-S-cluster formation regulator IscX/YfhJ
MSGCCGNIDDLAIEYIREIAVVLRTRNLDRVKDFYRKWQEVMEMSPMPDDGQLEIDMHKMICELPDLEDLHEESLEFLKAHGEAWKVRDNNCSHGGDPTSCGRRPTESSTTEFTA